MARKSDAPRNTNINSSNYTGRVNGLDDLLTKISRFDQKNNDAWEKARLKAVEKQNLRERNLMQRTMEEMIQLELKNKEQLEAYARKQYEEEAKNKLKREIEILKALDKQKEKEREKDLKLLKLQQNYLEKKATGDKEETTKAKKEYKKELASQTISDGLTKQFQAFNNEVKSNNAKAQADSKNITNILKQVGKNIEAGLNKINAAISEYASRQTAINARLQGISSYSDVAKTLNDVAFSPLINASELYTNVSSLVEQGVATNIEQRAFFQTVKKGIADSFDANSESILRIIRLQQNDSTAARLGMESYLTRFLNVYVENTEYLTTTFDSVASSLLEASSLLKSSSGVNASLEFEYVVQKWLGTLTGVGFSEATAQSIASALGQLGTGNVNALSGSSLQNLLVMSASRNTSKSYAEMLTEGLDANTTNELILGMVDYLQEIASNSSNVVKNQLASIFGVTVSDLIAVTNLTKKELDSIYKDLLTYDDMYSELSYQFSELTSRMGPAKILENLFQNYTYQTGMDIASNPALYGLWKITDLITSTTGGINIPFVTALGSGVDLNATVEQLMKLGIVGISTLGNIGNIIGGLGSVGNGAALLDKLKINAGTAQIKEVGKGLGSRQREIQLSENTYMGNTDSDAYYKSTINAAYDAQQQQLNQKLEAEEDPVVEYLKGINFENSMKIIATSNTVGTPYNVIGKPSAAIYSSTSEETQNYLASIEFDSKFNTLVKDVSQILDKMDRPVTAGVGAVSDISGLENTYFA